VKSNKLTSTQNELTEISTIYEDIKSRITQARARIYKRIDNELLETYWYVGKIVSELVEKDSRAEYGKAIIDSLSSKLTRDFGEGFTPTSIRRIKRFYDYYPIWATLSPELSWSHYRELIKIPRQEERDFYLNEAIKSNWGVRELHRQTYPTLKGFTRSNLFRMKQFYETYSEFEKVAPLARQLNWTNNMLILGATKTIEAKEFYLKMAIKNNYSKRELDRQISSGYFERYMLSDGKAQESLAETIDEDDYPNTKILDTYTLEFLDLPNHYSEKDLQKSIVKNLKDFILEIGKDFTFVGEEYKIQVDNSDFFIDLLFYNRSLSCLVAFELKIGKFKPEYISKMDFYLEALDRDVKKENENPSVGVILCASKEKKLVEYAMSRSYRQQWCQNIR